MSVIEFVILYFLTMAALAFLYIFIHLADLFLKKKFRAGEEVTESAEPSQDFEYDLLAYLMYLIIKIFE